MKSGFPFDGTALGRVGVHRWLVLVAVSGICTLLLGAVRLPSALLLGPMLGGILVATCYYPLRLPMWLFAFGQGAVGCMMSRGMSVELLAELYKFWPLFLGGVLWAVLAASFLGWLLTRWKLFPGTTAVWGMSPGGASAMMIMSQDYGADMRLVAFMQYVRVMCVALTASIVARVWVGSVSEAASDKVWFSPVAWGDFGKTVLLIGVGAFLGKKFRIPAGSLLVPMGLGVVVSNAGWLQPELPSWFLAFSYSLVGWSIGLRFTRKILQQAAKGLPTVLGSAMLLIIFCAVYAVFLVVLLGVDPLTAYLASSPGGVDSVAIIAASTSTVDLPFVMAMQAARLLLVLAIGPFMARLMVKRLHVPFYEESVQ